MCTYAGDTLGLFESRSTRDRNDARVYETKVHSRFTLLSPILAFFLLFDIEDGWKFIVKRWGVVADGGEGHLQWPRASCLSQHCFAEENKVTTCYMSRID